MSEDANEIRRIIDQAKLIHGTFKRDPLQLVLIIMFAGVLCIGIWHGRLVQEQTYAITEATEVIKNARK